MTKLAKVVPLELHEAFAVNLGRLYATTTKMLLLTSFLTKNYNIRFEEAFVVEFIGRADVNKEIDSVLFIEVITKNKYKGLGIQKKTQEEDI